MRQLIDNTTESDDLEMTLLAYKKDRITINDAKRDIYNGKKKAMIGTLKPYIKLANTHIVAGKKMDPIKVRELTEWTIAEIKKAGL
jgi:hypothetical protein